MFFLSLLLLATTVRVVIFAYLVVVVVLLLFLLDALFSLSVPFDSLSLAPQQAFAPFLPSPSFARGEQAGSIAIIAAVCCGCCSTTDFLVHLSLRMCICLRKLMRHHWGQQLHFLLKLLIPDLAFTLSHTTKQKHTHTKTNPTRQTTKHHHHHVFPL